MSAADLFRQFESHLRAIGRYPPPRPSARPEVGYWRHGIRMPALRRLVAQHARAFKQLSPSEQRNLTEELLAEGSDEAAQAGFLLLGRVLDMHTPFPATTLDRMAGSLRDWAATDTFCTNVLHTLVLREPDRILPLLERWSTSALRWKRRASVVAFARKVGASGRFTQEGIAACERLITDEDDLVRKGIGWALKDMMKGDKSSVLGYVAELRRRGISAVITLYAMKDLVGMERARLLAIEPRRPS